MINKQDAKKLIFFIALLCITFLNPRMKIYDYWIVMGSSVGIIFTLFRQQKFLAKELTFYSLIFVGLSFRFLPHILKIYIPRFLSYLYCFFYYKNNKSSDTYLTTDL